MSDLTWFGWWYLALSAFSIIGAVATIGKPREPRSPTEVIVAMALVTFNVWGLITVGMTS